MQKHNRADRRDGRLQHVRAIEILGEMPGIDGTSFEISVQRIARGRIRLFSDLAADAFKIRASSVR